MNVILLLAPFSVLLGLIAVAAFVWTLRAGQYEDMKGAAERVLLDEQDPLDPGPDETSRPLDRTTPPA
jgi:cbb3-type cytochrome oxidase maturation protein